MNDQYFTIEEIATRFKVTRQTVQNWIREGRLESVKLGRARRILGSSVDKLVADGRRAAVAEVASDE